jgi:dTDP-4-amino-4,6-dideoxygalactose transaminase
MVYYPLPLQRQEAFTSITRAAESLCIADQLAHSVLSLPMHTELNAGEQDVVINRIKGFF